MSSLTSKNTKNNVRIFSIVLICAAFSLPSALFFIRLSKSVLGMNIGEMAGFFPMTIITFIGLSLPCFLIGFLFSLACRVYKEVDNGSEKVIAKVYSLEAMGALLGGALGSYILVQYFSAAQVIFFLTFLNLLFSFLILQCSGREKAGVVLISGSFLILIFFCVWLAIGGGKLFDEASLNNLWAGFDVVGREDSVYGNIVVTKKDDQYSFYENGLHLYTVPDRLSSENAAHFALLVTEKPRRVLLIGGGAGVLEEILKHPVERVDYLEIDPKMIEIAEKHLPDISAFKSDKVNIINQDARFFVKNASGKYDCAIVSLGDPYTAQINRFYTIDFFREIAKVLTERGILSFAVTSSENYIGKELGQYLRSLYISAKNVFPEVLVLPGGTACFLAARSEGILTSEPDVLSGTLLERSIDAEYVREYYLNDRLSAERVEHINGIVNENDPAVEINSDFRPISYYYATIFWSTHFDEPLFRDILSVIKKEQIWLGTVILCLGIFIFCLKKTNGVSKRGVMTAVMTTGFSEIIFQIAIILAFQVIYGYAFHKMGMMIASFMGGLVIGSIIAARYVDKVLKHKRVFVLTQVGICFYPLILPFIFTYFSKTGPGVPVSWFGANIVFPFIPAIAGIMGGMQFPIANKIMTEGGENSGSVAGKTYGLDLFGAGIGALLAAAILIPVLGIFGVCYMTAIINFTVLAALML
ncbi:MAG: fused MFS/spermidine synthase [Candidatus Omnitrophota bacterium]